MGRCLSEWTLNKEYFCENIVKHIKRFGTLAFSLLQNKKNPHSHQHEQICYSFSSLYMDATKNSSDGNRSLLKRRM